MSGVRNAGQFSDVYCNSGSEGVRGTFTLTRTLWFGGLVMCKDGDVWARESWAS